MVGCLFTPRPRVTVYGNASRWRGRDQSHDIGSSAAREHITCVRSPADGIDVRPRDPRARGVNRCGQAEVSRLEEETIDRARCVHVSVLLGASGVGYPGGSGCGRCLAPVRGSSAALARDRRRPLPHGSPADAAGPPADTYRIRLSKEQRRLAQAVCSSPVPLMPLPTESRCPHGVPSFVDNIHTWVARAPRISSIPAFRATDMAYGGRTITE